MGRLGRSRLVCTLGRRTNSLRRGSRGGRYAQEQSLAAAATAQDHRAPSRAPLRPAPCERREASRRITKSRLAGKAKHPTTAFDESDNRRRCGNSAGRDISLTIPYRREILWCISPQGIPKRRRSPRYRCIRPCFRRAWHPFSKLLVRRRAAHIAPDRSRTLSGPLGRRVRSTACTGLCRLRSVDRQRDGEARVEVSFPACVPTCLAAHGTRGSGHAYGGNGTGASATAHGCAFSRQYPFTIGTHI